MKRLTADQVKLGFIGLGNMGSRIAKRLLDHAYRVSVYDVDRTKVEAVASYGGVVANNILELARGVDVLLSCLTNDEAVRSVYTGPGGVLAGAQPGTAVLEMSTISPETSREVNRLAAAGGIDVLDVAISGSTPAAEEGILTLLVGGDQKLFLAAEPIFQAVAKRYFLLGGSGAGTAMKFIADCSDRSGPLGKAPKGSGQRLHSAVSIAPNEQGLPVDSEGSGRPAYLNACHRSGVSRQCR
ncbi:MAG: hypothetical protein DMG83_02650 [Acidobacteria bacterium]|nr:MAG: hypothetical protein DMG83_02650 [Acidobacteriota bacterium]